MTDFDSIWRTQDEIRTVVNAVLGALGFAACYRRDARTPIAESSHCPFLKAYVEAKRAIYLRPK